MKLQTIGTHRSKLVQVAKALTPPAAWAWLYRRLVVGDIPGKDAYAPHYQPWREPSFEEMYDGVREHTGCPPDSVYFLCVIATRSLRLPGDVMEAAVWKGGTAKILLHLMGDGKRELLLFDSFEGMKRTDAAHDRHEEGDFSDTSVDSVRAFLGPDLRVRIHKGWIPETFSGLEDRRLCFAHIDVDLYESVRDCLEFAYPRMVHGGAIVLDDYGYASCPGARKAADEFFATRPEKVIALHSGQGLVLVD